MTKNQSFKTGGADGRGKAGSWAAGVHKRLRRKGEALTHGASRGSSGKGRQKGKRKGEQATP